MGSRRGGGGRGFHLRKVCGIVTSSGLDNDDFEDLVNWLLKIDDDILKNMSRNPHME